MSRDRGVRLQNALAAYLRQWWPSAEPAGSGRPGTDVLGTPGIVWECKTESLAVMARRKGGPASYVDQAVKHAERMSWPVAVWWPPGVGAERPEQAIGMLPLPVVVELILMAEGRGPTDD